jgi:uncharacterized protein (TIGR03435 family)
MTALLAAQPWVERLGWTLIHFLWQGALIVALYAIARRSRAAQLRYTLACLALAAMVAAPVATFLIGGTPSQPLPNVSVTTPVQPAPVNVGAGSTPLPIPVYLSESSHQHIMPWLVIAWFAGSVIFWVRLTGSWFVATRIRSTFVRPAPAEWQHKLDELCVRIRVSQPVRLLTSALVQVPTVVGWLRPVVLMPVGALTGLPAEHVEALLAHELPHIRRHDYLLNSLQTAAESLLFYHPAVWWVSRQIRNERELCCDDVAVAVSGSTLTYVRALADLEQQRPRYLSPALAANGGSLADRIARLLGQSRISTGIMPEPAVLVTTSLIAVAGWGLFAQTNQTNKQPRPSFEAVSIKPNNLGGGHSHSHSSPGRLEASMTTKTLIENAFGVKEFQIAGDPAWLDQANYDIVAKTPTPLQLTKQNLEPYLQSLLAERYNFKFHTESKKFAGYALMTAKAGPKLKPHTGSEGGGTDSNGNREKVTMTGTNITMPGFADYLSRQMDQIVVDESGLKGSYDIAFEWSQDDGPQATAPTVFTALQQQLGLRLQAKKVPMEVIVIDNVDKPSEN